MKKVKWADMDDDDPWDLPPPVSKHGVKIYPKTTAPAPKAPYVPPHKKKADKTSEPIESKDERKL